MKLQTHQKKNRNLLLLLAKTSSFLERDSIWFCFIMGFVYSNCIFKEKKKVNGLVASSGQHCGVRKHSHIYQREFSHHNTNFENLRIIL